MICALLAALLAVAAVVLYRFLTKNRGHLETLGIPVVEPGMFGSPPNDFHNVVWAKHHLEMFAKYGKTYGKYDGPRASIASIDPEVAKSVLVKNFDCFADSTDYDITDKHNTLDMANGQIWKSLRKSMSPTFSSGKLKGMTTPLTGVADQFMRTIEAELKKCDDGKIRVKKFLQGMSLDAIAACAFGIETDAVKNPDEPIIKYGREAFQGFQLHSWADTFFLQLFEIYCPILMKYIPILPAAYDQLWKISDGIMKSRESAGIKKDDFIARMIELKREVRADPNGDEHQGLNEDIITAQGSVFFIAGFETTSSTLSNFVFQMAMNPEVQEQVVDEIQEVKDRHNGVINHDTIGDMEFLEAAISETLRLMPPIMNQFKGCKKDCEVAPGLHVKAGMLIEVNVLASHLNPEFFPDPEKFMPERFLKENAKNIIPYTYRPFGEGPRKCIAQRFALVEIKIVLAKLLYKYRFSLVSEADRELKLPKGDMFMYSYEEPELRMEKRN